jgi:biopolymer transport protein ExbD
MDRRLPSLPPLATVNLTNLIDVCLTLLIIFMLTAPMMHSNISVNLPRTSGAPAPAEPGLTVTVSADTLVYINDQPVARAALAQVMKVAREQHPGAAVYLKADRVVAYGTVAEIIAELKALGIDDLGLMTAPREDKAAP